MVVRLTPGEAGELASSAPSATWQFHGKSTPGSGPHQTPGCRCLDLGLPASGAVRNTFAV